MPNSISTEVLIASIGVTMGLIELIKYGVNKYFAENKKEKDTLNNTGIIAELRLMNSNHLNHIEGAINTGNDKIVSAIQAMHLDVVKELSRKQ